MRCLKKRICIFVLAFVLAGFIVMPAVSALNEDEETVVISMEIFENAKVFDGKTSEYLYPLRIMCSEMGFVPSWNPDDRSVIIVDTSGIWHYLAWLKIGDNVYYTDEYFGGERKSITLASAPAIIDGRTYVPLEFFTGVLGMSEDAGNNAYVITKDYSCGYDESGGTVIFVKPGHVFSLDFPERTDGLEGYEFSHEVIADPASGLRFVSDVNILANQGYVGAPDFFVYIFEAEKSGVYTVSGVYSYNIAGVYGKQTAFIRTVIVGD